MDQDLTIRIHYPLPTSPLAAFRLALRTERDWNTDFLPTAVDDAVRFEFKLTLREPYLYFKPVLRRGSEVHWSMGENYLALPDGKRELNVFPHFFAAPSCSACELATLASTDGTRKHDVRVFYPPGYEENTLERYPVVYMQDGQNLFFPDEAFGGQHWKIDETVHILNAMNLVRRAIVVGIYPQDRLVDYTRPGYEGYGRFLALEVKPWVDERYRTLPGRQHTAVMGSSLGGVVSFYLAWQYSQVFSQAACLSSTFGWQDDLVARVEAEERRPVRFYLDSGWPRDNYEVTRAMRNLLVRRGWRLGDDLFYLAFPYAPHNEQAWAMRAHIPFQFFFPR